MVLEVVVIGKEMVRRVGARVLSYAGGDTDETALEKRSPLATQNKISICASEKQAIR